MKRNIIVFNNDDFTTLKSLTEWLQRHIRQQSFRTLRIIGDEEMYAIPVLVDNVPILLHTFQIDEDKERLWMVTPKPRVNIFRRLFGRNEKRATKKILNIVHGIIKNENNRNVELW